MKEVKYLLDVLIRNFCDSRVRDVGIEIERDAIAVDKICIHSCIVPVIILLREISGKRNGCGVYHAGRSDRVLDLYVYS